MEGVKFVGDDIKENPDANSDKMRGSFSYLKEKAKSKIKAKSKELVKKFGNLDTKESKAQPESKERERTFESWNADSFVFGRGLDRKKGRDTDASVHLGMVCLGCICEYLIVYMF